MDVNLNIYNNIYHYINMFFKKLVDRIKQTIIILNYLSYQPEYM